MAGEPYDNLFAHRWFIGTNDSAISENVQELLDEYLCMLNDDYKVERQAAIKKVFLEILPIRAFYDWLKSQGKEGGQHKFPRVLKNQKLDSWKVFLKENNFKKP